MPIKNLVVNCTDVQRSVEYYTKFLELPVVILFALYPGLVSLSQLAR